MVLFGSPFQVSYTQAVVVVFIVDSVIAPKKERAADTATLT
jgi:hypothetical protein